MQMLGFIGLFAAAAVLVTAAAVSLYAALPETVLGYAEDHGRFQGLANRETLTGGTRAGEPPAARPLVLDPQSV